jgi:hypothetical protein
MSSDTLALPISSSIRDNGWFSFAPTSVGCPVDISKAAVKVSFVIEKETTDADKEESYLSDEDFEGDFSPVDEVDLPISPAAARSPELKDAKTGSVRFTSSETQTTQQQQKPEANQKNVGIESSEDSMLIPEDNNDEYISRHYRLSVEVSSISAMRRAANLVVQFAYPHLDSTAPVGK